MEKFESEKAVNAEILAKLKGNAKEDFKAGTATPERFTRDMGLFGSLFRKDKAPLKTHKIKVEGTMTSPSVSPELVKADKLLKEATTKKKSGDINGAIKALRDSYKILNENSMLYSIQTYLRLPLYLQEAGKSDEAWSEFNRLSMWVNTKPRYSPEVTPMELSIIWDKMRLYLQRENKNDYAVQFAVWSYLSCAVGLYMQKREDELETYKAETNIKKALKTSLHKADKEFLTDRLVRIILDSLNNLPVVDYKEIAKTVQEEMKLNSK